MSVSPLESPGSHWWSSGGCWEFSFSAICPLSSEGTSRSNSEYTKSSGGRKSRCRSWEQESLLKVREWFSFVSRAHFLQICLHLLHPLLWKWSLRFHCLFLSGVILFLPRIPSFSEGHISLLLLHSRLPQSTLLFCF